MHFKRDTNHPCSTSSLPCCTPNRDPAGTRVVSGWGIRICLPYIMFSVCAYLRCSTSPPPSPLPPPSWKHNLKLHFAWHNFFATTVYSSKSCSSNALYVCSVSYLPGIFPCASSNQSVCCMWNNYTHETSQELLQTNLLMSHETHSSIRNIHKSTIHRKWNAHRLTFGVRKHFPLGPIYSPYSFSQHFADQ